MGVSGCFGDHLSRNFPTVNKKVGKILRDGFLLLPLPLDDEQIQGNTITIGKH